MNPRILTLARESRGLSQKELADMASIPAATLNKAEHGFADLSEERLEVLARVLRYPRHVLDWPDKVYGFGHSSFHHRKQQSLGQKKLRRNQALVNFLEMRIRRLTEGINIKAPFHIPNLEIEEYGSPAEVARAVRAMWMLPMGPVDDVITTLEAAGAFIVRRDLGSHRISAISVRMPDSRPLFVLNTGMPPDRERWTLCHEAAHLIMHEVPSPDAEREADQFAAELLLPAPEIRPQLHRIDLARAAALKRYWKVSMASLIRRAHDLEVIPANRYKSLCAQMAQRGFNRIEPIDLPREDPSLMDRIVRIHLNDHGYARDQLADILGYNESEFSIECLPASGHLRVIR